MNIPEFSHPPETPGSRPEVPQQQSSLTTREDVRRLQHQLDRGNQRLSAVERDNKDLRQKLLHTSARVERLERRLAAMLAAQTRQRGDLPSNAHADHQTIARDYQSLVEHHLASLALAATAASTCRPAYEPATLWFLGELTRALFQDCPTAGLVEEALGLNAAGRKALVPRIDHVLTEVHALRQRAQRTGLPFRWDFDMLPGARIDPTRQAAWLSCDPRLPVQYVIAPAYTVEQQVFCLQRVLTGPSF
ncbi:hypothetical protein [Streptomyces caeruleatus]|uniref:Uncharacterized protein n=1 Tax=Streptomyces caeruleatus TaxID=661399 RepID=A0A101U5Z6_9ACTN|nr:hypothetical protein [Streptomyces caeruleatus]KUO04635.1 hypothetical protein AQJ67_10575 [Streptomyces caeruleatus]